MVIYMRKLCAGIFSRGLQDMQCKVGDLGLAAKCGKSERKQTMCGTPNYIAPEILDATGHSFQVSTL